MPRTGLSRSRTHHAMTGLSRSQTHHAEDGVAGKCLLADDLYLEPADLELVLRAAVLQRLIVHRVTLVLDHLSGREPGVTGGVVWRVTIIQFIYPSKEHSEYYFITESASENCG